MLIYMCDECENEMYGVYGVYETYEMDGFKAINFEQILGVTVGYVGTAAVDTKVKAYATKQTDGYLKHLQNTYVRSSIYGGLGLVANAFVKIPFVKDLGKGAIVYGVKEAIAKAMPTMGIGSPNSTVMIENPNTTLRIEQAQKTVRERSLQSMLDKENPSITDSRLTGIVMDNARMNGASNENVTINY